MEKDSEKIQRKFLAVLMQSPFYFSIPLKRRQEFIKAVSQQSVYDLVCEHNSHLININSDCYELLKILPTGYVAV
jgi:hypothetical protein